MLPEVLVTYSSPVPGMGLYWGSPLVSIEDHIHRRDFRFLPSLLQRRLLFDLFALGILHLVLADDKFLCLFHSMRQSKPWLTMVDTREKVSGFVRPRRLG